MNKGLAGTIKAAGIVFFLLSFFSLTAYLFYDATKNATEVLAQTQNKTSNNITVQFPMNNSELFNASYNFTVFVANSSNASIQFVTIYFSNTTNSWTAMNLSNDTLRTNKTHQAFVNQTRNSITFGSWFDNSLSRPRGADRNMTVCAWNITSTACEWLNSSVGNVGVNFSVNEFLPQTIGFTWTDTALNDTNISTKTAYNVSLSFNMSVSNATAFLNSSGTGISLGFATNLVARNTTILIWSDSYYNGYNNVTVMVNDSFNNRSWANDTATRLPIRFKVDTLAPTLDNMTDSIGNYTGNIVNSSLLNFTFRVKDNNTISCQAEVYYEGIRYLNISGYPTSVQTNDTIMCNVNITNQVARTGNVTLYARATEMGFDRTNTTSRYAAREFNVYDLYDGFNYLTIFQNQTLGEICRSFQANASVQSCSIWNASRQAFTTFTVGNSANANIAVNATANATIVNLDSNATFVYYREWNDTFASWNNFTANTTGTGRWNIMPLLNTTNMNRTVHMCTADNVASGIVSTWCGNNATFQNITSASFFNSSAGLYCSTVKGNSAVSCSPFNVSIMTLYRGTSVWVNVNINGTINRTSIANVVTNYNR